MLLPTEDPCRTVMVVEDQDEIREMLSDVLRSLGYQVESAANGQIALTRLQSSALPCVILLDVMMPVMDGWQLIEALRRDPDAARAKIPIVLTTAVAYPRSHPLISEVQSVLAKPLDLARVLGAVEQYCG